MATRKNPLSALLNTDERKQAQEFTRDHVLRAATRQAGTYGVDVRGTLPVSQTSLGRLSASLGTMSGILNQFNQYQIQKEQAELRKEGLQHQIQLEGIRGEQLDETVKQQNIRIGELNQRRADAEFDRMFASLTPEQRQIELEKTKETLARAKRERTEAELAVERQNPDDYTKSPFYQTRGQRIQGAALAEDYAVFYEKRQKEILSNLPNMGDGYNLTSERAQELSEQILNEYLEANGLDTSTELGKGFLEATYRYNAAKIPSFASQLKSRSEGLNFRNLTSAATHFAQNIGSAVETPNGETLPPEPLELKNQDWVIQWLSMPLEKRVGFVMGTKGDPSLGNPATQGLLGNLSRTAKGANQLQVLFNDLADLTGADGKTLRDLGEFEAMQAEIEEAVERATEKEARQEVNDYQIATKEATSVAEKIAPTLTNEQLSEKRIRLIPSGDETDEDIRNKLLEEFPELEPTIQKIPDSRIAEFNNEFARTLNNIQQDSSKITDFLIAESTVGFQNYSTQKGAVSAVLLAKRDIDNRTDEESRQVSAYFDAILSGSRVTGGLGLVNAQGAHVLGHLDEDTDGLITKYNEDLNNIRHEVFKETGTRDITSEAFKTSFREKTTQLNASFVEELKSRAITAVRRRNEFLKAVANPDAGKEYLQSIDLEEASLYSSQFLQDIINKNPSLKPEKAVSLAENAKRFNTVALPTTLKAYKAETPLEAVNYEKTFEKTKFLAQKRVDKYTKPGSPTYSRLATLSDALARADATELGAWLSFRTVGGITEEYQNLIKDLNKELAVKYATSVSIDEVSDIASTASIMVKGDIPLFTADSWLNKPQGLFPDYRQRGHYEPGHYLNSDGSVRTGGLWPKRKRDAGLPRDFFKVNKPIVEGLMFPLGGNRMPKESDINGVLEKSKLSKESFTKIYRLYGYESGIEFLQDQYNNSYYTNQRTRRGLPPNK